MKLFKKKFKWWYILIAVVFVAALSFTGLFNELFLSGTFLGRTSDLTQGKLPCVTVDDCPEPKCFGSFSIDDTREPLPADATEAEKSAYNLGDTWYNAQGELKEVQCIEGKCETSPFCIIEYSDITNFLSDYPLAWVKEYPLVFVLMIGLFMVAVWGAIGKQ